jgi:hypothetical protein
VSLQDKIIKSQIGATHRLRDYKTSQMGFEGQVIRLKVEENMYGDESIQIINDDVITLSIALPDEIPQTRMRSDVTQAIAETQSWFLYDVLPIEGFAAHDDNVEKGDLLIIKIFDSKSDPTPFYLVLRVSEIIGTVSLRYMTSRKFYCSPHNMGLPEAVKQIIDNYKEA